MLVLFCTPDSKVYKSFLFHLPAGWHWSPLADDQAGVRREAVEVRLAAEQEPRERTAGPDCLLHVQVLVGLNLKISLCTIFLFQRALAQVRDIIFACGEIGTGVADQQSDLDSRRGEADLEQLGEEAR